VEERHQNLTENAEAKEKQERRKYREVTPLQN
jgi:hypothetical protein